jgi:hypothetical protein
MSEGITKARPRTKRNQRSARDRVKADLREQLFNEGEVGVIEEIQVSTERITAIRGILFDLDPQLYRTGPFTCGLSEDPEILYEHVIRLWLDRHPVLRNCEVRLSGTGLHAILWFENPVPLTTAGQRGRWAGIVKVVQASLPIDPDQPGITATTRALGSTNSKNGAKVRRIRKGKPVTADDVLGLFNDMCAAPFRTVLTVLAGTGSVTPCPICGHQDTELKAQEYLGFCYGSCGKVKLEALYDSVLAPRPNNPPKKQETGHHAEPASK